MCHDAVQRRVGGDASVPASAVAVSLPDACGNLCKRTLEEGWREEIKVANLQSIHSLAVEL